MEDSNKPQGNDMPQYRDVQQDDQQPEAGHGAGGSGNHALSLEPLPFAHSLTGMNAVDSNARMDQATAMVDPSLMSSEKRTAFALDIEEENETVPGPAKRLRMALAGQPTRPSHFTSDRHEFHNPSAPIAFPPQGYQSINNSPTGRRYFGKPYSDLGTANAGNEVQAALFAGASIMRNQLQTVNAIHPQVHVAARAALDALRNAIKREGHIKEIQEPAQGALVKISIVGHFYTQHHAWLLAAVKTRGMDPIQFPSCPINVNSILLQQKTFLSVKSHEKFQNSPLQNTTGWKQHQELAIVAEHCQLLYGWAAAWHNKRDNGPGIFTPFVNQATLGGAGQPRKMAIPKPREFSSNLSNVNNDTNATAQHTCNQGLQDVIQPQGFPHTTMTLTQDEINAALQWGQAPFEVKYLPMRIEGKPQFAAKDIFPDHPSSLEKHLVNDSTPILTVLEFYPNHIPSIGRQIMNDKAWSNQRLANILLEYGHQSIFSNFDKDIRLEWLKHWVKRRRGTATQGQRQAEKKAEKANLDADGSNDTESEDASVPSDQQGVKQENSEGVDPAGEEHETANAYTNPDPLSLLGEDDEAKFRLPSAVQQAEDHADLTAPIQQDATQNENAQAGTDGPTAPTNDNGSYFEEASFGKDLASGDTYHSC